MTSFDAVAESYDAGGLGYASGVYDVLVERGLHRNHSIVDIGCGTGLASVPLIEGAYRVTGVDPSEPMPALAQSFHHVDRNAALAEIRRVLRSGALVAIWWKHLTSDDATKLLRDSVMRELGVEPPESGLRVPWRTGTPLSRFMQCERSRTNVREALGLTHYMYPARR
jgi:ubiquinone/menaquinone biosynthesis C-methylase UbiE